MLWGIGSLDRWELTTWHWRVRYLAKPVAATDKIKLIVVDQPSLDWGKTQNGWSWPWPREAYTPIIDFCRRSGARVVAFDVLFSEPSVYGVSDDEALGAAIRRAPAFVASLVLGQQTGDATAWPANVPRPPLSIEGLTQWPAAGKTGVVVMGRAAFPIPEVATNATLLANVADAPDADGVFRRATLVRMFDGQVVPSVGLAAYLAGSESVAAGRALPARLRAERGRLRIGDKIVPVDNSARSILRFRGPVGTHQMVSAAAVIQSELRLREGKPATFSDPQPFKDCYVLVGFSAPGLLDLRPTPVSSVSPGTEIHATVLDNLLANDFLADPPASAVVMITLLLAWASGLAVIFSRKVWQSILMAAVFLPVPALAGVVAYGPGWWWPVVLPECAVVLALASAVAINYSTEARQKIFIKRAFEQYLSPVVIRRILDEPGQLRLGGERRELTILFSDLEGFTKFSERLDPQALTRLLNDYLSEMSDIILAEEGTLDKYVGDAIVAFWNAPLAQPDHAVRACRAALRCQRRLAERREEFERLAGVALRMRVGINTGEVAVGNMGSRQRFNYSVLGDSANLASRLEGANKSFGTYTMVAESSWLMAREQFHGREIGLVRVVGRQTPVRVVELVGTATEPRPAGLDVFERGLACCRAGQWADALTLFDGLPDDPVAKTYAARCRHLLQKPETGWDGIWDLTTK